MERGGDDFSRAQGAAFGQVEHELGRGLCSRCINELDRDAIDHALGAPPGNLFRWCNQADRALRQAGAETGADMRRGAARNRVAEHEGGATAHLVARDQVFADGMFKKADGSKNWHTALGCVVFADHAACAAKMVGVAVRVEKTRDGALAQRVIDQFQRGGGRFNACQRIDDDPAGLAFDDTHHGEVIATHLPDAGADFEQAMFGGQA